MGETTLTREISAKFLCGPRRFQLVYWLNSSLLFVRTSSVNMFLQIAKRLFEGRGETVKFIHGP
jgi:hypothetical protein